MIRGVIFDIDGTLVDSVDLHARAWQETLRHFGHDVPFDRVRSQIGKGGDQLMPALLPEDVVREQGEAIEAHRGDHYKRTYLSEVRAFPRVRELFERLRADGRRLALASSAKGDELEAYKRITGIGDLIESETSSDDAERSKPHPDIFRAALSRLDGLGPDEVLVVGDTPYDAEAAARAGIRSVGLTCGGWTEAELKAAGCVAVYRDPDDLLGRYEQSPLVGGASHASIPGRRDRPGDVHL